MSILSTNKKIINIGKEYSAGSGIDITNDVISVIGNTVPYSAGENIDIQNFVISGKDWSNDITNASANAYNETTAWVHDNYTNSADVSFLSGEVDKKLDSSAWGAISGSLATEDYVIISDNLTYSRATAFTTAQEYAKESACNSAFDYLNENKLDSSSFVPSAYYPSNNPSGFITGVDLSDYYKKTETSSKEEISAAIASIPVGDPEVNSFVESNSATINEVNTSYQTNSGDFLTSEDLNGYATEALVEETSGAITSLIPTDFITNEQLQTNSAAITAMIPSTAGLASEQYVDEHVSGKADKSEIPDVSEFITNVSAEQTYQPIGNYLSSNALEGYATEQWVGEQGYITGVNISESAKWEEATTAYEQNSGTYLTSHQDISNLMPKSESANFYPMTGNPSGFLTTHQDLSDYQTTAGMTAYEPTLSFGYDGQNKISSINNSAIAGGGGGVISSYTTAWASKVPPYGGNVIYSLNGMYISSFLSNYADKAGNATNANSANSAGYAQTVNVNYVENQGFVRNLSSEYGTISVIHNNLVESTNSAILRTGYEGFVSSFGTMSIGPNSTKTFSWDKSLPNTKFTGSVQWPDFNTTIHYSADTNLTGEILAPQRIETTFSIDIPNVTSLNFSANQYIAITNNVASAADTFETTVGELALASALPTYEYNSTNKISAINGSAIAAGDEFPASANEAITSYQTNSGSYLTAISIPESANWNAATTTVQTNSSTWDNVTNKLDTTSFSNVSSTFLTAVDLTPYATTNDLEQVSGDITALIPSTAGLASESYVQTNSAVLTGMIDAKQDTLTFGYDEQDRINSINNSAIAGAVSANAPLSGDGSNSQPLGLDLKTDNSLSGNGTLTSPLSVVPGYNETVLYSGSYTHGTFPAITASGSIWDYEKVEITLCPASGGVRHPVTETWYTDDLALNKYVGFTACTFNGNNLNITYPHTVFYTVSNDGKVFNPYYAGYHSQTYSGTNPGTGKQVTLAGGRFNVTGASTYELGITRIIGINHKK